MSINSETVVVKNKFFSGRYQAYSEYFESNVCWMGLVPAHWNEVRFKRVLTEKSKVSNPSLPAGSISFGEVIYKNEGNLSLETKASYQEVLVNELLINPLNLNFDLKSLRTALSKIDVVVSTGYIIVKSAEHLNKRFMRWFMQEFDIAHMKTLGSGVRQTINFTDIANCSVYLPNWNEQTKIANFIDHETAKIDTLIEKQQQLIKLLKEKRQAVISHAVTKGLNPDAPMKDSGVEWLGGVPEHWDVLPIRRVIDTIEQGTSPIADNRPPEYPERGVLKISSVKQGCFNELQSKTLSSDTPFDTRYLVKRGDLLLTRANTLQLVADACYVEHEPDRKLMLCDLIYRLKTNHLSDPQFLCFSLLSDIGRLQIELDARGSSMTMAKVSQEHIKSWIFAIPPIEEQPKIVEYIKSIAGKLDATILKSKSIVELLKERRTALISAAVTGKIDVRNWVAPMPSTTDNNDVVA